MNEPSERRRPNGELVIDNVLASQPELGPSIPDGGYGWVVFLVTLFFQALIPSLIVTFGIFLVFARMQRDTIENMNPKLWDNKLLHVPLFFTASWTLFDPTSRAFIAYSTWPRLVATTGTCLTCAGLLFLWMGMMGQGQSSLFVLAGIIAGLGASIQMAQCEIILAQYFKLKHQILAHLGHAVSALGYVVAPIIVGHHILNTTLLNVILWYQAVILQGLILNLAFKKPPYLKSKRPNQYKYVLSDPDDEEDVLSKNSRELQTKRQDVEHSGTQPSSSTRHQQDNAPKQWVSFEDEEEEIKYERGKNPAWITFGDNSGSPKEELEQHQSKNWETFEENNVQSKQRNGSLARNTKNLQLELSFGDTNESLERPSTTATSGLPTPLFSDTPVNNNNTYSYDVLEDQTESPQPVFVPNRAPERRFSFSSLEFLQQPTFYKSLITLITTKFSIFVFYSLYPSYLYQEVENIRLRHLSNLVGAISLTIVLFSGASYWINIDKKRRPISIWLLCWTGTFGYFMISDYTRQGLLLSGAVLIAISIAALQHIGTPLMGLTIRGETTKEYGLLCIMCGMSFLFFVIVDPSFKDCFRLMALLNFFTGGLWLSNFIYKRLWIR